MASVLQRIRNLTATDPAKRQRFLAARRWARERAADHVVQIGEESFSLFPAGGFAAASDLDDEELHAFFEFLYMAMMQYATGFTGRASRQVN